MATAPAQPGAGRRHTTEAIPGGGTRLPPMQQSPEMYEALEKALLQTIRRHVFLPLIRELLAHEDSADASAQSRLPEDPARATRENGHGSRQNALSDLVLAIAQGEIQYVNGAFEGKFRAAISREIKKLGGTYDRRRKRWSLPYRDLPVDCKLAIGTSRSRFEVMAHKCEQALSKVLPDQVARAVDMTKLIESSVFTMDQQFLKNVARVGVVPKLSQDTKRHIARQYTQNTQLDIEEWTRTEVQRLRKTVYKNTFEAGLRREALLADIQKQYGVTARKARFLAKQETSLLMASYQIKRYQDVGVKRYEWVCVNNPPHYIEGPRGGKHLAPHSVRPDHWELNHTIQLWSSPPIVDKRTMRRRHPQQDYNCRCTAIPILDEVK